jgi:hypothetical protein
LFGALLIYRGNFADWIDPTWRELVLNTVGQARPRDWPSETAIESAEYSKAQDAGYDLTAVNWWVYEEHNLNIKIDPPWCTGKNGWWITKLMPGQFMPMHTDPFTHYTSCKRFWIPLQDFKPGHLFIYGSTLIKDYKAGDVYEYIDSHDTHGAANIGHEPRVVLQVTEYV